MPQRSVRAGRRATTTRVPSWPSMPLNQAHSKSPAIPHHSLRFALCRPQYPRSPELQRVSVKAQCKYGTSLMQVCCNQQQVTRESCLTPVSVQKVMRTWRPSLPSALLYNVLVYGPLSAGCLHLGAPILTLYSRLFVTQSATYFASSFAYSAVGNGSFLIWIL